MQFRVYTVPSEEQGKASHISVSFVALFEGRKLRVMITATEDRGVLPASFGVKLAAGAVTLSHAACSVSSFSQGHRKLLLTFWECSSVYRMLAWLV